MKTFTIIKVGYTAGIYGCSGEYFTCIITNSEDTDHQYNTNSFHFYGMYGPEERVAEVLKGKGYKDLYTQSHYGQLKRRDINKNCFKSETQAIEYIKELV